MINLKRRSIRTSLSVVLSLLLLVDFSLFNAPPAKAETKDVLIGAGVGLAAGAGLVLAGPAIGSAMGLAGAGLASMGTAIIGGLAAAGGAIVGAFSTIGTAIAVGAGALGGWIAGIVCSPLFVAALVIIAAAVAGYLIGRYLHKKKGDGNVIPGSDKICITPAEVDMNTVPSPTNGVKIGDSDALNLPGTPVNVPVAQQNPTMVSQPPVTTPVVDPAAQTEYTQEALVRAEQRYKAAYSKYTQLVTTGGSGDVQTALREYRESYREYSSIKAALSGTR
ncbi:MAG: hypothetical protein HQM10_24870 [Candidatus Riflebacteria bacterium]|nr:hypothetical protein [Candidatus Riflebacteria bacterium]